MSAANICKMCGLRKRATTCIHLSRYFCVLESCSKIIAGSKFNNSVQSINIFACCDNVTKN